MDYQVCRCSLQGVVEMSTTESRNPIMSPKALRVMHVIPTLGAGGAEKLVASLASGPPHSQVTYTVVSLYARSDTDIEEDLQTAGVDVRFLNKHSGIDVSVVLRLQRLIRIWRPDIVHSHLYAAKYAIAAAALAGFRTPVVHTCHNPAFYELPAADRVVQRLALRTSRVVVVGISESVSKSLKDTYGLGTVPTILNGIELGHFDSSARPRDGSGLVYCAVGRFELQKGHEYLIRAFAKVHEQLPSSTLLLAGNGSLLEHSRQLVQDLHLGSSVVFLGHVSDIPVLLANSDVFVMSSLWEGFCLALVEAQASGLPAVASAVDAIPEVVRVDLDGLLVPPANVNELAAAMLVLGRDRDLRQQMGQAARDGSRRFDIATTRAGYESLYHDVLDGRLRQNIRSKSRYWIHRDHVSGS